MEAINISAIKRAKQSEDLLNRKAESNGMFGFLNKEISFFEKHFGLKEKEAFFSELSLLLSTGVDIRTSLEIVMEEVKVPNHRKLLQAVMDDVTGGARVSEALSRHKKVFNKYEKESIKIGEETGRMPEVLKELGGFYQSSIKLKRQIIGVLTYPVVVIVMAVVIVYFMLSFVVPVFSEIFIQTGNELPLITQTLIKISEKSGTLFSALAVVVIGSVVIHRTQKEAVWYRAWSSALILKVPVINKLVQKIYLARFCQSMKLLSSAKVMIHESLDLVKNMVEYYPIEKALETAREEVINEGVQLHESLAKHAIFPKKLIALIKLSEEVNAPEVIFEKLYSQYSAEIEHQQAVVGKLIEPVFIVVLGLFVGFILVAMYLPMFEMSSGSF